MAIDQNLGVSIGKNNDFFFYFKRNYVCRYVLQMDLFKQLSPHTIYSNLFRLVCKYTFWGSEHIFAGTYPM